MTVPPTGTCSPSTLARHRELLNDNLACVAEEGERGGSGRKRARMSNRHPPSHGKIWRSSIKKRNPYFSLLFLSLSLSHSLFLHPLSFSLSLSPLSVFFFSVHTAQQLSIGKRGNLRNGILKMFLKIIPTHVAIYN